MRALFVALCFCLAIPAAEAQSDKPPATQGEAPSAATVAAARDFMSLLMVESGAIDRSLERAASELMPVLTSQFETAPFFAQLPAARRDALRTYMRERYPALLGEMVAENTPRMLDNAAAQLASLFSEQEMTDIAAFVRTEPARGAMVRLVLSGVEGKGDATLSPEEEAAFVAFALSPSGRAFEQRLGPALELLGPTIESGFTDLVPALQVRVAADICALLENDCPPALRAIAAPI